MIRVIDNNDDNEGDNDNNDKDTDNDNSSNNHQTDVNKKSHLNILEMYDHGGIIILSITMIMIKIMAKIMIYDTDDRL